MIRSLRFYYALSSQKFHLFLKDLADLPQCKVSYFFTNSLDLRSKR